MQFFLLIFKGETRDIVHGGEAPIAEHSHWGAWGDISPFFVLKHCSSGSITKSIHFPDFWSPFNEEPLDDNRLFWVKRLFLFAHPTGRVLSQCGFMPQLAMPLTRVSGAARRAHSRSTPWGQAPSRHTLAPHCVWCTLALAGCASGAGVDDTATLSRCSSGKRPPVG